MKEVTQFVFVLIKVSEGFNPDDGFDTSILGVYTNEDLAKCELSLREYEAKYIEKSSDEFRVSFSIVKYPLI